MFKHTLLLAFRNFKRYKSSFIINLLGLSAGLFSAIMIYLWVNDELHVDKFHEKDSRLFQVMKNATTPAGVLTMEDTPGILAEALAHDMPEVEYASSTVSPQRENKKGIFLVGDNRVEAQDLCVDKDFLNIFSFQLLQGNKDLVLAERDGIVISDELALKLFHTTDNIMGKTLEWNRLQLSGSYRVAGVFKKLPANSSMQFDVLFSYQAFLDKNAKLRSWKNGGPATYIVLKKGTDVERFNSKLTNYLKDKGAKETLFIQGYSQKYLYGQYENGAPAGGRISYVRLFSIIALFILVIACINFMNLSTAKAVTRLKEVGVKKVMGAARTSLVMQYIGESLVITFLSLLLAILPVIFLLPWFNEITGKQLRLGFDAQLLVGILVITLVTGLLAGSYPALYISGFKPVKIFKGNVKTSIGELWARKGLVIFQFAISVILIVSVLVVYKQIELVQTKNLGYVRDHVIYFGRKDAASVNKEDYKEGGIKEQAAESFLQVVKGVPGVVQAAHFRHNIAAGRDGGTSDVKWEGKNPEANIQFTDLAGGYGFIETLGIELKEGRSFSQDYGAEKTKIIFNEAAIENMGLTHPIGKVVKVWGEDMEIIGVAKNFNFQSLYEAIKPCFIYLNVKPANAKIMVKIQGGAEKETFARLQRVYGEYNMGLPMEYRFLDDDYQALYASEKRVEVLSGYFAGVVILISCLGLFGLAAFTVQKRYKEIGIRKVLGSSNFNIVWLLWNDFNKMIIAALVIALPLSYFIVKSWLDDFAYRIDLKFWYFILAGILTLIVAWLTVGTQTIKATKIKPSETLRGN
jgi:ABC-type antimicrobial peptide transport system permease subunit